MNARVGTPTTCDTTTGSTWHLCHSPWRHLDAEEVVDRRLLMRHALIRGRMIDPEEGGNLRQGGSWGESPIQAHCA